MQVNVDAKIKTLLLLVVVAGIGCSADGESLPGPTDVDPDVPTSPSIQQFAVPCGQAANDDFDRAYISTNGIEFADDQEPVGIGKDIIARVAGDALYLEVVLFRSRRDTDDQELRRTSVHVGLRIPLGGGCVQNLPLDGGSVTVFGVEHAASTPRVVARYWDSSDPHPTGNVSVWRDTELNFRVSLFLSARIHVLESEDGSPDQVELKVQDVLEFVAEERTAYNRECGDWSPVYIPIQSDFELRFRDWAEVEASCSGLAGAPRCASGSYEERCGEQTVCTECYGSACLAPGTVVNCCGLYGSDTYP